ncbi:hypothetical protein [Metabacillus fastidiosus]|uniref:Uncharacterized protein n=1 Tax=Metabacillus fastidiosus TaxID=1458 RepID=A0ABU6NRK9_9BACI|nr:hypothetical protein [Metabacillus fastidiosus]
MRIILAVLLALPIYITVGTDNIPIWITVMALQFLAGANVEIGGKRGA